MTNLDLNEIRIASPCKIPWDSMKGTETKRYCSQCHLNVYNISQMTTSEAVKLIGSDTGYCFSLYRRPDGTVITRDCPVGLARLKKYLKWSVAIIGSFLTGSVLFHTFMAKEIEEEKERQRAYKAAMREMGAKLQDKGKVVFCVKPIQSGEVFSADCLREAEVKQSKIPMDSVTSAGLLVKEVAKCDISTGQIICLHHIVSVVPKAYRLRIDKLSAMRSEEIARGMNRTLPELLSNWIKEELF